MVECRQSDSSTSFQLWSGYYTLLVIRGRRMRWEGWTKYERSSCQGEDESDWTMLVSQSTFHKLEQEGVEVVIGILFNSSFQNRLSLELLTILGSFQQNLSTMYIPRQRRCRTNWRSIVGNWVKGEASSPPMRAGLGVHGPCYCLARGCPIQEQSALCEPAREYLCPIL